MDQVTVVAFIKAKQDKVGEVRDALLSLIGPTRQEEGCINYDLHESRSSEGEFVFYEIWRSHQDLDRHLNMPYLVEFVAKADDLLAEPLDIRLYRKIG